MGSKCDQFEPGRDSILEHWADVDVDADLAPSLLAEVRAWLREAAQAGDLVLPLVWTSPA